MIASSGFPQDPRFTVHSACVGRNNFTSGDVPVTVSKILVSSICDPFSLSQGHRLLHQMGDKTA